MLSDNLKSYKSTFMFQIVYKLSKLPRGRYQSQIQPIVRQKLQQNYKVCKIPPFT